MPRNNISLICDSIVTTQNVWFFRREFKMFWIPIIFWEQQRHNCSPAASFENCVFTKPVKSTSANVYFYINNSNVPNFELWRSCRKWVICTLIILFIPPTISPGPTRHLLLVKSVKAFSLTPKSLVLAYFLLRVRMSVTEPSYPLKRRNG